MKITETQPLTGPDASVATQGNPVEKMAPQDQHPPWDKDSLRMSLVLEMARKYLDMYLNVINDSMKCILMSLMTQ